MRPTPITILVAFSLVLAMSPARGEEPSAPKAADTATAAVEKDEFRVPPGFRTRKRGKHTVYCRKEDVVGTRFATEKCYDEAGIREWKRAQVENQKQLDQMRRICGSQDACGGG